MEKRRSICLIKDFVFVCFESNLTEVSSNILWLNFAATTHVYDAAMQGFLLIQTINPNENFMLMGNQIRASIETIGTYHLFLDASHHLEFFKTFYVRLISKNFVF